jgi:hypothetical protein
LPPFLHSPSSPCLAAILATDILLTLHNPTPSTCGELERLPPILPVLSPVFFFSSGEGLAMHSASVHECCNSCDERLVRSSALAYTGQEHAWLWESVVRLLAIHRGIQ